MPRRWIPVSEPNIGEKERQYVDECLRTTWISSRGRFLPLFEKRFSRFAGTKYAVACSNGTVALHLALLSLGIGPGDEVLVPTLTYVATANAVSYTGATPVFVDAEPDTWNIDLKDAAKKVSSRTRAVIPVHLYGHSCDMKGVLRLARKHGLFVVEDAAEGIGTLYQGSQVGSMGSLATFSFFGNKTITTGEGGMVVTNNRKYADQVRHLAGQALVPGSYYDFDVVGYNYRLTNMQAALGYAQIGRVRSLVAQKRRIARWYRRHLAGIPGLELPVDKEYGRNSYWMFSILINREFGVSRDEVIAQLRNQGVETRPFFAVLHQLPMYRPRKGRAQMLVAEDLSDRGINLPSSTRLVEADVQYVCKALESLQCRRS